MRRPWKSRESFKLAINHATQMIHGEIIVALREPQQKLVNIVSLRATQLWWDEWHRELQKKQDAADLAELEYQATTQWGIL